MKKGDAEEVERMITAAFQHLTADLAAYMDYYSERLATLEELHGVEPEDYPEFLDKFGNSKIERTVHVYLTEKGHHAIQATLGDA